MCSCKFYIFLQEEIWFGLHMYICVSILNIVMFVVALHISIYMIYVGKNIAILSYIYILI